MKHFQVLLYILTFEEPFVQVHDIHKILTTQAVLTLCIEAIATNQIRLKCPLIQH